MPRELLYDNLKSAVTERVGDAIRFNPTLLELASHYHFGPRAAAPYRGNEKGRVERSIRYIRDSFFAAREFVDLAQLNTEAAQWCEQVADARGWPEDRGKTVAEVFAEECRALLPLPDNSFPAEERVEVKVGKTPYLRFDQNDYSVPHTLVRRELTVLASIERIRVLDGPKLVAEHARSFDKARQIEHADHVDALVADKRRARRQRGMGRLNESAPASDTLLDEYGADELEAALIEINTREVVHVPSVRHLLEQRRHATGQRQPMTVELPNAALREIVVRAHDLSTYDLHEEPDDAQD